MPALILGILGIVICALCAPFAWWQGKSAENAIAASPGRYGGKGMATTGKILGMVGVALWLIAIIIIVIVVIAGASSTSY